MVVREEALSRTGLGWPYFMPKTYPKQWFHPRRLEKGEKIREGNVSQEGSRRTWKEREGNESQRSRVEWKEWSRVEWKEWSRVEWKEWSRVE